VNFHFQSIAKIEAQLGQVDNTLNRREDEKLPSQPVANPKGHYMLKKVLHSTNKFRLSPHCEVEEGSTIMCRKRRMSKLSSHRTCRRKKVRK
jgi:hypothetical protein